MDPRTSTRCVRTLGLLMALALTAIAPLRAQAAPRSLDAIPLFPGSTLRGTEEGGGAGGWYDISTDDEDWVESGGSTLTYHSTATPEEVFRFYRSRFGGVEYDPNTNGSEFHTAITEGISPVTWRMEAHVIEDYEIPYGPTIPAAVMRGALAATRPPMTSEQWLVVGAVEWLVGSRDHVSHFVVEIVDEGLVREETRFFYRPDTVITISRTDYRPEEW